MKFKKNFPRTYSDIHQCYREWNTTRQTLRFGQYMCNNYLAEGETWTELFYEDDTQEAYILCCKEVNRSV